MAIRPLEEIAQKLGESWTHLRQAEIETRRQISDLEQLIGDAVTDDISFVVFGSLARYEATAGSDLDWTLLVDAQVDPAHFDTYLEIDRRLQESDFRAPAREGTFGDIAFSHEIVHKIGGQDDINQNTTQRILLLLESLPIGDGAAHDRVVRSVLTRYISEDWGWRHGKGPRSVPRFLQNDFARYWRTVAVDFAYKRRARATQGWAIRTIKLRLSRKATYAAALLGCFSCELESVVANDESTANSPHQRIVRHLKNRFQQSPLDIIATAALKHPSITDGARKVFQAYNDFVGMLNDQRTRDHLASLVSEESAEDPTYQRARDISHSFQNGLDTIFFDEESGMGDLTKTYGVF